VTGEVQRGRVVPADRDHLRQWLARFAGCDEVHFALEGCAGWRYVVEELAAAGIISHRDRGIPLVTASPIRGRTESGKALPRELSRCR
jgi:transposase